MTEHNDADYIVNTIEVAAKEYAERRTAATSTGLVWRATIHAAYLAGALHVVDMMRRENERG